MIKQAFDLLRKFYPPEGLYLKELSNFSHSATLQPNNTCVASRSFRMYLLSVYHDGMTFYGSSTDFERLMLSGQMWYRRMNTKYLRPVTKGEDFQLRLEMTGIVKVRNFAVARLVAKGPIAVEAEFVAPL